MAPHPSEPMHASLPGDFRRRSAWFVQAYATDLKTSMLLEAEWRTDPLALPALTMWLQVAPPMGPQPGRPH